MQFWLAVQRSGNVVQSFGLHSPVASMHTCEPEHVTWLHAETHRWLFAWFGSSMHCCLVPGTAGQVTPKHGSATQKSFGAMPLHFLPSGHGNSPGLQRNAH